MSTSFFKLKVLGIDKPIPDAATITFEAPSHFYDYHPGQHLILKFDFEGKEFRRSYSINSCPFNKEALQITVKKVKGGVVSNFINDQLKVGDEVLAMQPQGRFFANLVSDNYKTYFLFAAGSGITPIYSILKSILLVEPNSRVHLFYGNSHQDSIIFKEELKALQNQYPNQLNVVHTLSDPKVWTSWEQWKGRKGRIDQNNVEWFIDNHPPVAQSTAYFICGPGAMNISVRNTLMSLGIPKELIHIEHFGGPLEETSQTIKAVPNAQLRVHINGKSHNLIVADGKTILETVRAAKLDPPYSCESGVCASCVARLEKGKAEMKVCMALEERDIEKGLILTCQAIPTSDQIEIKYE